MNRHKSGKLVSEQADVDARIFAESIIETIREPLLVLDQDLRVINANAAFYRKFQVDEAETEGQPLYSLGNRQWDIPALQVLLERIIPENEFFEDFEIEHNFQDIGHRIMHLNARKVIQEGARRSLILLAIEDVTERIETRRALEESEALYNRLVEEINSIIIDINSDGIITFVNRFAEKIFGYSREELVGKELVGTILPETDSEGTDNYGLIDRVIRDPERYYLNESVGLRKDGREVWFSWSARSVKDPETGETTILVDGNDMTYVRNARRQAREALEIIHASKNAIVRLDLQKNCLLVNHAFADLTGKRCEEIEGTALAETGLPDDLMYQLDRTIDRAARAGKHQAFETVYGDAYLLIRVEPEFDENNRVSGSILFFNDITLRKQAEEELCKLNDTLEQRVDERTRLASFRARQLQKLSVDLIEAEERERQRIAQILHDDLQQLLAAARMQVQVQVASDRNPSMESLNTIDSLLEESISKSRKLSHELIPPVLRNADLASSIEWLAKQMEQQFGLKVRLEKESDRNFRSALLKVFSFRAVQELLLNIVKHAGVDRALISLSDADDALAIIVSDQGKGFSPKDREFSEETGLGLTSLQERTESLGGSFAIESAPGKGSRFTLLIPLDVGDLQAPAFDSGAAAKITRPIKRGVCKNVQGIRVLFANNHRVIRQGLISLVREQPDIHVIGETENGRETLERVRESLPDVVVMDASMTEMDGVDATYRIKAQWPEIRVIGLSMHPDDQNEQKMLQAGAETVITKAAPSSELLRAIYGLQ